MTAGFHYKAFAADEAHGQISLQEAAHIKGVALSGNYNADIPENTRQMILMIGLVALACMILITPLAFFAAGS